MSTRIFIPRDACGRRCRIQVPRNEEGAQASRAQPTESVLDILRIGTSGRCILGRSRSAAPPPQETQCDGVSAPACHGARQKLQHNVGSISAREPACVRDAPQA